MKYKGHDRWMDASDASGRNRRSDGSRSGAIEVEMDGAIVGSFNDNIKKYILVCNVTILYYTILYYTILYYTILYYTMLCYTILY